MTNHRCSGCGKCNQEMALCPKAARNDLALWQTLVAVFESICGRAYVITDPEALRKYGSDQTQDLFFAFDILLKPASPEEISAILKVCNQYKVPVTPRGGGSGVTGGALPCRGGVVITTERLNEIISIHKTDAFVMAGSGVITNDLCLAVQQESLYFPVQPSSSAYCCIGGNVAENAGSMYSCKYGTTERYVLNLEVVLPTGEIIWTGANVSKNATGLNLTRLFVGSEGILGIITKVVYRLLPAPAQEVVLLAGFESLYHACQAVTDIRASGIQPAAVELISKNAWQLATAALNRSFPLTAENMEAHVLIECQQNPGATLNDSMETIVGLLSKYTSEENILMAETSAEKKSLRQLRLSIGDAMIAYGDMYYRDVDMAVPVSLLYSFIKKAEEICEACHVRMICFGHAWDGNMHMMLMRNRQLDEAGTTNFNNAVEKIYRYGIAIGGTISAEHGIGLLQNQFMDIQFSPTHLALMKGIKSLFDPNGIMNPGKVF